MKDLLSIHAAELLNMSDKWRIYSFQSLGEGLSPRIYKLKGCDAEVSMLGEIKYTKENTNEIFIPEDTHISWKQQWELQTGNCAECVGTGKVMRSWSSTEGTTYKACTKCGGSGKI